jgi:hypothetical protein
VRCARGMGMRVWIVLLRMLFRRVRYGIVKSLSRRVGWLMRDVLREVVKGGRYLTVRMELYGVIRNEGIIGKQAGLAGLGLSIARECDCTV